MKNNCFLFSALLLIASACGHNNTIPQTSRVNYVDPKIGSGGHGHVFVGANIPYGMVQAGPTSIPQTWDWTSGYHDSDSTVIGFSQTHLSGTGIGDLFDITIMPVTGEVTYARGYVDDYNTGLWSYADRSKEITKPGYYSVPLTRYGILAEITATNHVGVHRFSFPEAKNPAIVFDLQNGGCWDRVVETKLDSVSPTRVTGFRKSKGWAADQTVYFVADFSQPFSSITKHGRDEMYSRVNFPATTTNSQTVVKVGISPNSIEKAIDNLNAEAARFTFEEIVDQASQLWEKELAKIDIETDDPDELKKFYTALYHLSIHPSTFNDVNETPQYTILSLWDTYRTQMPLLTIIDPERQAQIVNSMLDIYDQQGRLPVWHLWGNETDCMVGNPGIIVVADAVSKSLPGIDKQRALNAMIVTSNDSTRGGGYRQTYGYIPFDLMEESIGYDLEYAIADAAIANAAKSMGKDDISAEYENRSKSYKNYFDPSTGFMRGKDSKGEWRTPFNPSFSSRGNDYTEGNAWQYTWLVPHDFEGLKELFGGKEQMMTHLDSLFIASSEMVGDDVTPDISGMIGQYVQGNEPSHHIIYFYSMADEREKAANLINQILEEQYSANPDGLSGNEDAGQMSAWFIMSALGFYPVEPALPRYWIGVPRYEKATIHLPENKTFTVIKGAKGSKIRLNGQPLYRNYITHEEIMKGGEIIIPVFN